MQVRSLNSVSTLDSERVGDRVSTRAARPPATATAANTPRAASTSSVKSSGFARYNRWALIGYAQQRIGDAQASEQKLVLAYRQLQQINTQLGHRTRDAAQLAQQIRALDRQVSEGDSQLNAELKPKLLSPQARRQSYVMDRVDLTSPKNADERLQMVFPSSAQSVSVALPAASQGREVAALLHKSLASERVAVSVDDSGQLVFSVDPSEQRKLQEPVLLSGQGIRVPAGNPVPVRLKPAPTELSKLADSVQRGDTQQEQMRLQKLLRTIEGSMRELKAFRQQVANQLDRVRQETAEMTESELAQIQRELVSQLHGGDFTASMTGLVAQANASRDTVVALLRS